jgi:hypothetical protein
MVKSKLIVLVSNNFSTFGVNLERKMTDYIVYAVDKSDMPQ